LEKHNGGRWPIVIMDLGNKTVKKFKTQIKTEMKTPQEDTTLQALEATHEGLQNDKEKTQHPTITPTNLLPTHKRPQHYKADIIRARNTQGQSVEDTTYKGRRCLQLIECKYSTDNNTLDTITNIHNIYEPLKQTIVRHDPKKRLMVQIIPIVISITGNFHTRTLAEIAQLVSFKENLPDNITYKSLPPQAQTIAMAIHVHAQEWLTLMSKVSRFTLTQRRKTTKHSTTNNNN
jgi:hypothetical protein